MVFFASQLGGGLAQALPAAVLGGGCSLRREGIINLCGYGAAVGVGGFLVYLLLPRAPGAGLRARWSDVPRGLLAFVAAMPVVLAAGIGAAAAAKLITGHEPPVVGHGTLQQILDERTNPWVWAIIVGAVIGAPITEELTFRAFLQSGLLRASGSPVLAILVTGTVFALMHVGIAGVHTLPTLLVLGLAMGIAFERTKRLGVPITMHAAFNVAMLVMAMAGG
jgi:membrane protease YdiL (CAAX protease family)